MSEEGASGMSAAQLRAKKRQDKIRASAGTRLGKLTTSARGEEADYIKSLSLLLSSTAFQQRLSKVDIRGHSL